MQSESSETTPFEVFVVAVNRKDGKMPGAEKIVGHIFFPEQADADKFFAQMKDFGKSVDNVFNDSAESRSFSVYKAHITITEKVE